MDNTLVYSFFLIFSGASVIASLALATRQPLLVAYIVLGAALGPYGFALVKDTHLLKDISEIGIMFLLFLLGLDMQPSHLRHMLRKTALGGTLASLAFAVLGYGVAYGFGMRGMEAVIIGISMMFSSTIIGIKLLPTTVLHHRTTGELVVGILLLQDIIAMIVLLVLYNLGDHQRFWVASLYAVGSLPALAVGAFIAVRFILLPVMQKFDRFHEYLFLVAIGWCLGLAQLAHVLGLSPEIGAFIAGISMATSPIALYIANNLKPLRDFFLILFFFSVGASFDITLLGQVLLPALALSAVTMIAKPLLFSWLLNPASPTKAIAWEVSFRLSQTSEFSILIAYIAVLNHTIGNLAAHIIQATAIITFLLSSYIVIFNFKSPIAVSDRLRRD